jgi:hypothetical protein
MALSRVILAFAAGFISVLVFHQGMFTLLHAINLTPRAPFPTTPTQPFGIPQIWSLAFWGGVWGIGFAAMAPRFRQDNRYWIAALLFGAIAPTLVAWFIVAPLKNQPIAAGFQPAAMLTGLLVNGAWGLGTALLLRLLSKIKAFGRDRNRWL